MATIPKLITPFHIERPAVCRSGVFFSGSGSRRFAGGFALFFFSRTAVGIFVTADRRVSRQNAKTPRILLQFKPIITRSKGAD
jgi:hypothetical protein